MFENIIKKNIEDMKKKNDEWLYKNYEAVKNEFGKKVCYRGLDYIIVGLEVKSENKESGKMFSGGHSYIVTQELYLVLKSSFNNSVEISLSEYWNHHENNL